jgi:predicted dehydrogenase
LQLFGLPQTIGANLAMQRTGAQTDDWFHVLLNYDRLRVILHGSLIVAGGIPRLAIHGTRGSWIKSGMDVQEKQLVSGLRPGEPGWGEDPRPGLLYQGDGGKPIEVPVPHGDHRQYYFAVRDAIRGLGKNPVPPAQAVAVMAVLETAIESSATGKVLPVPLIEPECATWRRSLDQPA